MGWPKYMEDDIDAMEERRALMEPIYYNTPAFTTAVKKQCRKNVAIRSIADTRPTSTDIIKVVTGDVSGKYKIVPLHNIWRLPRYKFCMNAYIVSYDNYNMYVGFPSVLVDLYMKTIYIRTDYYNKYRIDMMDSIEVRGRNLSATSR